MKIACKKKNLSSMFFKAKIRQIEAMVRRISNQDSFVYGVNYDENDKG